MTNCVYCLRDVGKICSLDLLGRPVHGVCKEAADRELTDLAESSNLITTVCSDGLHDLCSTRICVNPSDGWHNARYQPCGCPCHSVSSFGNTTSDHTLKIFGGDEYGSPADPGNLFATLHSDEDALD